MPPSVLESGKFRRGQQSVWILFVALGLIFLGVAACGSEPEQTPQAKAFAEMMRGVVQKFNSSLAPYAAKEDGPGAEEQMKKDYAEAEAKGSRLPFAAGVLNKDGRLLAVYSPDYPNEDEAASEKTAQNYGGYKLVQEVLQNNRISNGSLHFTEGEFFVVCGPLTQQNQVVGVLVLAFEEDTLLEGYGITREEFLSLNINQ